jgi:hypothetical protein
MPKLEIAGKAKTATIVIQSQADLFRILVPLRASTVPSFSCP